MVTVCMINIALCSYFRINCTSHIFIRPYSSNVVADK